MKSQLEELRTNTTTQVAVAAGDGIGPEIMDATLKILAASQAGIEPLPIEMGEKIYLSGNSSRDRSECLGGHR